MDMTDIEKEIADLMIPSTTPGKRIDYSVKHSSLKVIVSKAMALLFFASVGLFAYYVVSSANSAMLDYSIVAVMGVIYLALAAFVAIKLWHIEFIGWLALFYISLAGIALPAISAYSRGIGSGTIPIMVVSFITLGVLWLIRDLYQVYAIMDIFRPPRQPGKPKGP